MIIVRIEAAVLSLSFESFQFPLFLHMDYLSELTDDFDSVDAKHPGKTISVARICCL